MTKLDSKTVMDLYNKRLQWCLRLREVLPQLARIGEELGAPEPSDVVLGGLYWCISTSHGTPFKAAGISVRSECGAPGTYEDGLHFCVQGYFKEDCTDLLQLEKTTRGFYKALLDAKAEEARMATVRLEIMRKEAEKREDASIRMLSELLKTAQHMHDSKSVEKQEKNRILRAKYIEPGVYSEEAVDQRTMTPEQRVEWRLAHPEATKWHAGIIAKANEKVGDKEDEGHEHDHEPYVEPKRRLEKEGQGGAGFVRYHGISVHKNK